MVKVKRGFVQCLVVNTPLMSSGMARVLKGFHSFTCTPRAHLLTDECCVCSHYYTVFQKKVTPKFKSP